jgi:Na+-transporting methylmalonyl-CoA/oxaloacetate decarboxylase gamma subunit
MTFQESLLVAIFCISMVFAVLILISAVIKIFSFVLQKIPITKPSAEKKIPTGSDTPSDEGMFSSGTLQLKDVDEPTAAMIMAIVSDESGIPLSELCFKSISLVHE